MFNITPIPYGKQEITDADIAAVAIALKSDFLTQGPAIQKFEEEFAKYIGSKYAVAVANGTAALHLSALALNVKPGQKVITTPITFAASANCVRYCGGEVHFADINPDTYLIDIEKLNTLIHNNPKGTFAGIIPVDFAGYPVEMEKLSHIAREHNLWIIEDACHAPGGYFMDSTGKKQYCGNGAFADLAIFSFHPVKHIATGEGGMITTNDLKLYDKLLLLRTHGITKNIDSFKNELSLADGSALNPTIETDSKNTTYPGWYYEMIELGFNYRITDIQAALGSSQLKRAEQGLERRTQIAQKYYQAFKDLDIVLPKVDSSAYHAYHLFVIQTNKRFALYNHLRENKIFAQVHYEPVHLQPYYMELGWQPGDFPIAEKFYSRCLSLPMYPSLTIEQQDFVINTIKKFFQK